jgi:isopentenyl diphosphate isomerase/L-lactate dehydrogenase-like FMN-dependent dehydrogenase
MAAQPVNIFEYEELARERIEKGHYDFIAGGATDEAGVLAVLEMLRDELDATMGMCGRPTIDSIDIDSITMASPLLAMFPHHANFR